MRLSLRLLAVACCAGLALPAIAAEGTGGPKGGRPDRGGPGRAEDHMQNLKEKHPELFARFDANHDGVLDPDERKAARAEIEKRALAKHPGLDKDKDGQLSREEFKAAHERLRDGRMAEFKERHPKLFAQADTNADGTLDEGERAAARTALEKRMLEKHPAVDADGDGALSREEFQAARERLAGERMAEFKAKHPQLFAKADSNGDGTLDVGERKAAREMIERHLAERGEGAGKGPKKEHGDHGRRAHGQPDGDGHDRGRRGKE